MVFQHDPAANSNVSSSTGLEEKPVETKYLQQSNTYAPLVDEAEDPKFEKRSLRKVDWRILLLFGIIYTVAYVDRANISVARISGIDEDLNLDIGDRASIALLVFFVGYIIFEIPSNILIKKVGAANWIAAITVAWGAVTIGQGFIHNWISLCILRAFLGAFEAGLYPGMVYIITCWYTRYEVQKRLAAFYFTAQGLASFGSILAYGLIQIGRYTPEYKGWRWIYIVEGAATVLLGIVSWFIIVDFPASKRNNFLNERQKIFVIRRVENDVGDEDKSPVTWAKIWETAKDGQIWCYSFIYMTGAIGGYSFTLFLPLILEDSLHFTQELSFLLSTPPVLFSVLIGLLISYLCDHFHTRGPAVILLGILSIIGFVMVGFLSSAPARYVGTFIGQAGVSGFVITSLAWQANNIRGDAKRSIATAFIVMASGVGGIYSSLTFREQNAPGYVPGMISVLAPSAVSILVAVGLMVVLRRRNAEADRGERVIEGGEKFRYTI